VSEFTDDELLAYLDELLPVQRMAAIEKLLRASESLRRRVADLARRRDQGVHSVGEIWRRWRLSCPTRSQLGSYVLDALEPAYRDYIDFHIETVGCRICAANLSDLQQDARSRPEVSRRRRKYFESSAGYLKQLTDRD
jgi:anti-sigma factor RsiW